MSLRLPARGPRVALLLAALAHLACTTLIPASPTAAPRATQAGATQTTAAPAGPTPTRAPRATPNAEPDTRSILRSLGARPCPDSDFTCVTLTVPLDHFSAASGATLDVVFGVLPASGERRGMFVTATGGPGASGLAVADGYTSAFDPALTEHFDIVFFDQRGIAASGSVHCPRAAAAFYQADWQTDTPAQREAFTRTAETLARDCVSEMGSEAAALLPYLGTAQAVEDLESFRAALGAEQMWLYGESYGTQFAQTYAAAHPDRLAGLILDGTVDLTLSGVEFYRQQAQAFAQVLADTLAACDRSRACAADFAGPGSPAAAYDDLARQLAAGPLDFDFPLPNGAARRSLTLTDLETAASGYMYSESYRMQFLRALAAAARGDLSLLARQVYSSLGLDPLTLEPYLDPTYSDAVYYAVECQDYEFPGATPAERAQNYLDAGQDLATAGGRLKSVYLGDLPCAFWPAPGAAPRPAPLVAEGVPTLVLGATADPATPVGNGEAVYRRLADGYLVTTEGGPHVIFGRGEACPDDLVTAFLLEGARPAARETTCPGDLLESYAPISPLEAAEFGDVLDAMLAFDFELYYLPEYYDWDYYTPTSVGCAHGGAITFRTSSAGHRFTFQSCAFTRGFVVSGAGRYDDESGTLTLEVTVSGDAEGELTYTYEADGTASVTGTYAGEPVDLSD